MRDAIRKAFTVFEKSVIFLLIFAFVLYCTYICIKIKFFMKNNYGFSLQVLQSAGVARNPINI